MNAHHSKAIEGPAMEYDRTRRTPRRLRRDGFSLIELLLVLVILATLAAIVVPKFTGRSRQARITAAQLDIKNIESALDALEAEVGRFPTEQEGLAALMEDPGDMKGWNGRYLKQTPLKDPWGTPYFYAQPGKYNTKGCDIWSAGPNMQEGDDDDICNWITED